MTARRGRRRGSAAAMPVGLRVPTLRTWADIAVVLVLIVLGVLGFEPAFGGYGFLLAGIGGLVIGTAVAIGASILRLTSITTALVAILAYFLLGTPIAVPSESILFILPSLQSLASLAVGAVFGWADLVTLQTPVGAPAYIAAVPYFATWLVSLVSVTLAARWLPAHQRAAWRHGIMLIAPVAVYLAGVLTGTDEPFQAGIRGIAFAVIALVWLGWRRGAEGAIALGSADRLRRRKLAGTAVLMAGAVLVGGGSAIFIAPPNDQRFVLREEIEPPFDPLDYPSPLAGFRHYSKQSTDDVIFSVEGLRQGDVIRLATLDSFTGKLWNVTGPDSASDGSGSFALVGRDLPRQDFLTADHRSDVTITVEDYDDVWIPSVGYATTIDVLSGSAAEHPDDLRFNYATGTAALTSGLSAGDRVRIQSDVQQQYTAEQLDDTRTATLELPPVEASPDVVTAKAGEFAGDTSSPAAQLEAIARTMIDTGYLSHGLASDAAPSRAGHGADRVQLLLERNQMIGDEEQYASAFALMARSLGYPARVVMGLAPEVADGQDVVQVTGADVTAWVEVAFDGIGWVSYQPTPDETDIPQDQTPKPKTEPQPQVRQPPRTDRDDEELLTPVELDESEDEEDNPFIIPGWVYVLGLSVLIPAALFFGPALIVAAIKARRARKRRFAPTGDQQVAGAWEELIDRLSELGFGVPQKRTRLVIADELGRQLTGEHPAQLKTLAAATDEAVFFGQTVDPERSERVWTEALAVAEGAQLAVTGTRHLLSRFRIRRARDWVSRVSTKGRENDRR